MLPPPNADDQAELHHISTANTILIYQEKLSMGQLKLISKGSSFTLWAQVSTLAAVLLVCVPALRKLWHLKWVHASAWAQERW
jgi:hypothetical protein